MTARGWVATLDRLIKSIPFHKVDRYQAFDLGADLMAILAIGVIFLLGVDFGAYAGEKRFFLVLLVIAFIIWSHKVNQRR